MPETVDKAAKQFNKTSRATLKLLHALNKQSTEIIAVLDSNALLVCTDFGLCTDAIGSVNLKVVIPSTVLGEHEREKIVR